VKGRVHAIAGLRTAAVAGARARRSGSTSVVLLEFAISLARMSSRRRGALVLGPHEVLGVTSAAR
jgi:hypothetical protein